MQFCSTLYMVYFCCSYCGHSRQVLIELCLGMLVTASGDEKTVSPQQPLWVTTNRYNMPRQHWLGGGRERAKSEEPSVSVSFRWLGMKVFLWLPTQVEYKHYLKSNYSYYKSIVSMQVEMVPEGKLLRLWYRPQRYFKRLVFKSLLITVKYVDCSKPTCN